VITIANCRTQGVDRISNVYYGFRLVLKASLLQGYLSKINQSCILYAHGRLSTIAFIVLVFLKCLIHRSDLVAC
jgi:hypothetical protein